MTREARVEILRALGERRDSTVVSYVTGDRTPVPGQIGDDAVRPLYDHLRAIGHVDRLDLFLYSRGGAIDVPWRIVTALRQTSAEWNVLIPFRANSAATLLALGADQIVMGRQGELGPIDPILSLQRVVPQPGGGLPVVHQENVNIEDVMAYLRFAQERGNLSDQASLSRAMDLLVQKLDAVALGNIYRTHSHIRDVARRMLRSRKEAASEQQMRTVIETLAEKVYAHGHAIGLREAEEIGLPVEAADDELDELMWRLLTEYESGMKLLEPLDPAAAIQNADVHREDVVISMVESTAMLHEFRGALEVQAKRQMPGQLSINMNVGFNLPPGLDVNNLPPDLQQLLQTWQQALQQQAYRAVQEAVAAQAPLVGIDVALRGARWLRSE